MNSQRLANKSDVLGYAEACLDPVASGLSWQASGVWACNYRSHELVEDRDNGWQLRPHWRVYFHTSIYFLIGIAALVVPNPRPAVSRAVGLALLLGGLWFLGKQTRVLVIDPLAGVVRRRTLLWTSERPLRFHALQLLKLENDEGSFKELNAITADGTRIGLLCYPAKQDALEVARSLAHLLRVPVWLGATFEI